MTISGRQVTLVVTCTNRKRLLPHPELTIRALSDTPRREPWKDWLERIERVEAAVLPARDLYVGQHWHAAKEIAATHTSDPRVRLWILSAGYGLVSPEATLKSYSAVFTSGQEDSVSRLMADLDPREAVRRWWSELARWSGPSPNRPRSIADLARLHPHSLVILALSPAYLSACRDDILEGAAALVDPERLLLVCPGSTSPKDYSSSVRPLPIDARAVAFLGGTMGTLGVRFVQYLLSEYDWSTLRAFELRPLLEHWLSTLKPPDVPKRLRHGDADVAAFIRARLVTEPHRSATRLLREYRDLGEACEQKRFRSIYSSVKEEWDAQ